jgi:hypothetical protein
VNKVNKNYALFTDIYISYAIKLRKLRTKKNDNIDPKAQCYYSYMQEIFVILKHRKYISVGYAVIRNFLFTQ